MDLLCSVRHNHHIRIRPRPTESSRSGRRTIRQSPINQLRQSRPRRKDDGPLPSGIHRPHPPSISRKNVVNGAPRKEPP
jgi:hypothetical protein